MSGLNDPARSAEVGRQGGSLVPVHPISKLDRGGRMPGWKRAQIAQAMFNYIRDDEENALKSGLKAIANDWTWPVL